MEKAPEFKKSEWEDETALYTDKIKNFFAGGVKKRYDSMNELHFSGGSSNLINELKEGKANIIRINVFRENEEIKQIAVVIGREEKGGYLDVYLKGNALKDFLES